LDLKFITGFRVKNGNLIARFVKKEKPDNSSICDEGGWAGIDMGCNQTLDEVILESSSPTKTPYVSISHIYPLGSASGYDYGSSWSYPSRGVVVIQVLLKMSTNLLKIKLMTLN